MIKTWLLALALSNGIDAGTSVAAFRRGAVERNPLVVSTRTTPFLVQVSAATAGELWLASKVNKHHPTLTRILVGIGIAAGTAASINNIRVYHSLGRPDVRR